MQYFAGISLLNKTRLFSWISLTFYYKFLFPWCLTSHPRISLVWRRNHYRSSNFDIYSVLNAIKQCAVTRDIRLLWSYPTCFLTFGSGDVSICSNDLRLSRSAVEPKSPACKTNWAIAAAFWYRRLRFAQFAWKYPSRSGEEEF